MKAKKHCCLLNAVYSDRCVGDSVLGSNVLHIRDASIDDVHGIRCLMEEAEATKALVMRTRAEVEANIVKYAVVLEEGRIVACACFVVFPVSNTAEVGAFTVSSQYRGRGIGAQLLQYMERQAKDFGLSSIFVLTNQAADWFLRNGFEIMNLVWLLPARLAAYNWSRRSQVLMKNITRKSQTDD